MKLNVKNGIFVGAILTILALSACTGMSKKEQETARLAEIAKLEQLKLQQEERSRKAAKVKKKAEAKQKLEAEDTLEVQPVEQALKPQVEKLPAAKPVSAAVVTAADMSVTPISDLDIPTAPNTYLVTAGDKGRSHPFFGAGSKMGFSINGVQGNYIIAKRGDTLTFNVRTGVRHDFYLTGSPMGWGAAAFMDGVEGQFTYEGDVTFKVTDTTPELLYYGCRNHNSMGGKIVIVAADANIEDIKAALENERQAQLVKNKDKQTVQVTPQMLNQKISYIEMLLQFRGGNMDADHKAQILTMLFMAKNQESAGELDEAFASAQSAEALFNQKPVKQGLSKEELAQNKEEFNDLLITLEAFIDSHKASYQQTMENDPSLAVDYDHDVVSSLMVEAKKLEEEQKFKQAKNRIQQAENLVNSALSAMLGSQTLVYELEFKTPADEYKYEVSRYQSYEDLIPVAIDVRKPSEGAINLMKTFLEKGRFFKQKSKESADAGRWEEALVVIRDATTEVRRGLQVLGVSM